MTSQNIGQVIREKREKTYRWSRPQLAERAHVHPKTIERIEAGEKVKAESLADTARALGLTPDLLASYGEDSAAELMERIEVIGGMVDARKAIANVKDRIAAMMHDPIPGWIFSTGVTEKGVYWVEVWPEELKLPNHGSADVDVDETKDVERDQALRDGRRASGR